MLVLDVRTIALLLGIISVLQAVVLLLYFAVGPRYHGVQLWVGTGIANAVGFVLLLLRGIIPDFLSIFVANTALLLGLGLLYQGVNQFVERRLQRYDWVIMGLLVATAVAFTPLGTQYFDISTRTIALSITGGIVYLLNGWHLARWTPADLRSSYWFTASIFGAQGAWSLGRALLIAFEAPLQSLFSQTTQQVFTFLALLIAVVLWAAGLVAMNTQRLLRDLRLAQASERALLEDAAREVREREQLFRLTFDQSPIGAALVDFDNRFIRVNAVLCEITGYHQVELLALDFPAITHPDDVETDLAWQDQLRSEAIESYTIEKRYIRKDGRAIWVQMTGRLMKNADGEPLHFLGLIEDISGRKRAEEALRRSQLQLEQAIWGAELGLWDWHLPSGTMEANEQLARLIGEPLAAITPVVEVWQKRTHPDDLRHIQAAFADAIAGKTQRIEAEYRILHRDGTWRWQLCRGCAVEHDDAGMTLRLVGITQDLTSRKQVEQTLRQRIDELLALNQIAQALTTWTEIVTGLESVGAVLGKVFDADVISVWSYEPQDSALDRLIVVGNGAASLDSFRVPLENTAAGRALLKRSSATTAMRVDAETFNSRHASNGSPAPPVLAVPLRARNAFVGLLCIRSRSVEHVYAPTDIALAQTMGGLLGSALENARLFSQAQSIAAERERRRLANELHDSVSQALFAANRTASVLPQLWELDPEEGHEALADLGRFTAGALAEMRALLIELRPRALENTPLHETLGYLTPVLATKGALQVESTLDPAPLLPSDVQIALYRIAQEALNNVSKHASAHHVTLLLQTAPAYNSGKPWCGTITITVCDDGRGYDPSQTRPGRLGLVSMRERAAEVGATLETNSQPGAGTQVVVQWHGDAPEPARSDT